MSREKDQIQTVRRTVVVFDICSSTIILEELLRTENQQRWRNLLIGLKKGLVAEASQRPFEIYKFLGDGWILLFDDGSYSGSAIIQLLQRISGSYHQLFHRRICFVLGVNDHLIGLTYGIDCGTLLRVVMNGKTEYLGRAINVAARLQGAVAGVDKNPEDKLLITKNAYSRLKLGATKSTTGKLVECRLRNIAGGERAQVRKLTIL